MTRRFLPNASSPRGVLVEPSSGFGVRAFLRQKSRPTSRLNSVTELEESWNELAMKLESTNPGLQGPANDGLPSLLESPPIQSSFLDPAASLKWEIPQLDLAEFDPSSLNLGIPSSSPFHFGLPIVEPSSMSMLNSSILPTLLWLFAVAFCIFLAPPKMEYAYSGLSNTTTLAMPTSSVVAPSAEVVPEPIEMAEEDTETTTKEILLQEDQIEPQAVFFEPAEEAVVEESTTPQSEETGLAVNDLQVDRIETNVEESIETVDQELEAVAPEAETGLLQTPDIEDSIEDSVESSEFKTAIEAEIVAEKVVETPGLVVEEEINNSVQEPTVVEADTVNGNRPAKNNNAVPTSTLFKESANETEAVARSTESIILKTLSFVAKRTASIIQSKQESAVGTSEMNGISSRNPKQTESLILKVVSLSFRGARKAASSLKRIRASAG